MNDTTTLAVLIGAFTPLLISVVVQGGWKDNLKALVSFVICAAIGAGVAYFTDEWTRDGIVAAVAMTYGTTQITQSRFWKPTNVTPTIEARTNIG